MNDRNDRGFLARDLAYWLCLVEEENEPHLLWVNPEYLEYLEVVYEDYEIIAVPDGADTPSGASQGRNE